MTGLVFHHKNRPKEYIGSLESIFMIQTWIHRLKDGLNRKESSLGLHSTLILKLRGNIWFDMVFRIKFCKTGEGMCMNNE